jgi:peptide/nickel transport system substrate-binding protein
MFAVGYAPDAAWNDTQWDHERFESLRVAAQSELDQSRRGEMYGEMQRILRDEGGVVVPFFANYVMGLSERIAHGKMASNNTFDGQRAVERWWMT